jgi:hypothetical protein
MNQRLLFSTRFREDFRVLFDAFESTMFSGHAPRQDQAA